MTPNDRKAVAAVYGGANCCLPSRKSKNMEEANLKIEFVKRKMQEKRYKTCKCEYNILVNNLILKIMKQVITIAGIENYSEDWEKLYYSGRIFLIKVRYTRYIILMHKNVFTQMLYIGYQIRVKNLLQRSFLHLQPMG